MIFNDCQSQLRMFPFPHLIRDDALLYQESETLLHWLEQDAPWKLKIAEFYQQYEFSFDGIQLPEEVANIFSESSINNLRRSIENLFKVNLSRKVHIVAHKLTEGQVIRIHNDFIPGEESHRVLIQLNRGWTEENGGLLMLFSENKPESLTNAFLPLHNTAFAFEISSKSFHAVSSINSGERFTIVISFFKEKNDAIR
ncbi:cyclophane-containing peptide 2OG-Fe(II) oxygenase YhhC [Aquaspirillum serpens]|uniref:cyclophane-containing peptide 2OG-Fe(II) oxygenase YhhC n=1 Tax=Aquaspirillum serpens TaxID=190 RepID=UPI0003B708D5|nr:cyclophane-containing peptide 2OG-Fe(II) oxygenase YhhC [Aquaspirillum serpens]